VSPDYELIVESDIMPNKTLSSGWVTGGFESQEPAQFEERHLIFLQQLGKVTEIYWLYRGNVTVCSGDKGSSLKRLL
jgi:hypothetical protein